MAALREGLSRYNIAIWEPAVLNIILISRLLEKKYDKWKEII